MAAIGVIFGGISGFFSALVALLVFNASWLVALGLWCIGGTVVAALLITYALVSHQGEGRLVAKTV